MYPGGVMSSTAQTVSSAAPTYPVRVDARLDDHLSRWLWLVKWLLAIPHFLVLVLLFWLLLRFAIHYRAGNDAADRDHRIRKSWHWEVSWTVATLVAGVLLLAPR